MSSRSRKKDRERSGASPVNGLERLEGWIGGHRGNVIGVALGLNLLLCLALFDPKLHTGGDNAVYINLAQSLLTPGVGYALTIYPGAPQPHTVYPFGYPVLLSPVVALFGPSVIALKALSLLLSLGTVWIFALLALRLAAPLTWAALTLTVAVNPVIVEYSHWILSEIAFLFFSVLTIYLMLRAEEERGARRNWFFISGLLAMAFTAHIRTIGLAFPLAGFIYLALKRSWRRLAVFAVLMPLLLAPWMVRNRLVDPGETDYGQLLLLKNPYSPEEGRIGLGDLPGRVLSNLKIYTLDQAARVVLAQPAYGANAAAAGVAAGLFSLLVLLGLAYDLSRGVRLLEVYVLVYLGVVLIWPEVWSDIRFIMTVIPFFMVYLADGVSLLCLRLKPAGPAVPALRQSLALCLAALLGLGTQLVLFPETFSQNSRYLHGDRHAGYPLNWRHLFEAGDWVRGNTPKESVVTVRKPGLFALVSERKVFVYPFSTNADSVLALIRATDYVVIDAVSATTQRYLIPALQKAPGSFRMVFDQPYAKVLEVHK